MSSRILVCVGGPNHGKTVSGALGDRWPMALAVGYGAYPHNHLVGWYERRATPSGREVYRWTGNIEQIVAEY